MREIQSEVVEKKNKRLNIKHGPKVPRVEPEPWPLGCPSDLSSMLWRYPEMAHCLHGVEKAVSGYASLYGTL